MKSKRGGVLPASYAKGLFMAARGSGRQNNITEDVLKLCQIALDKNFQLFIESFAVKTQSKILLIKDLSAKYKFDSITENFLQLMLRYSRSSYLYDICQAYMDLLREQKNVKLLKISSSTKLKAAEKQELEKNLAKKLAVDVEANYQIDPMLIKGITIQYDSFFEDYSLAGITRSIKKTNLF